MNGSKGEPLHDAPDGTVHHHKPTKKEIEKAKVFQNVTRELSKEISKREGLSLVEKDEESGLKLCDGVDGLTTRDTFKLATSLLIILQILVLILFGACTKQTYYSSFVDAYQMFTGVEIMIFFGFGYLMTFLKRYGMGAVGFTMLITVIGVQWGIITEGFFTQLYHGDFHYIDIDIYTLMNGLFMIATVLITFGAIIGKVSPLQLVILTFLECIFYAFNKSVLVFGLVDLLDAGGTVNMHMFGAYYGLAITYMLGKPTASAEAEGGHISDLFSLIGTLFLFIYWPSFNGAALDPNSDGQQRAIVNTFLSLLAAATGSFITSSMLSASGKFRPVDIQNATLAGGVAMGCNCNLTLQPATCLLIGLSAGCLSTFGFARIQGWLDERGVHDTCGIHNLHAMPSLIGGFASIILTSYKAPLGHDMPDVFTHSNQAGIQCAAIIMTLLMAISSGLFTGWVLQQFQDPISTEPYSDEPYWEVMDDFGRSFEDEFKKNLTDLQAGLEASRSLRDIIGKYRSVGMMDWSCHTRGSSRADEHDIEMRKRNDSGSVPNPLWTNESTTA